MFSTTHRKLYLYINIYELYSCILNYVFHQMETQKQKEIYTGIRWGISGNIQIIIY